jgi:hypothetical protein
MIGHSHLIGVVRPLQMGMDCQARCIWLDLSGGRLHLNSVVAYQKPSFALNLNVYTSTLSLVILPPPPRSHPCVDGKCRHGFGERFISSVVANPIGLYQAAVGRQADTNEARHCSSSIVARN